MREWDITKSHEGAYPSLLQKVDIFTTLPEIPPRSWENTPIVVHFNVEGKSIFVIFSGNGYISTDTLKEILKELDSKLTNDDLENIIEEVDEDGSGTLDFDEFMEMMAG